MLARALLVATEKAELWGQFCLGRKQEEEGAVVHWEAHEIQQGVLQVVVSVGEGGSVALVLVS